MERTALVKSLRSLANATDALLRKDSVGSDDIIGLQRQLGELQSQPLAGPGVDLAIENSVLRLRLKITTADFAPPAAEPAKFSLSRLFSRPLSSEEAVQQQQIRLKKELEALRKEIGNTLFALVM